MPPEATKADVVNFFYGMGAEEDKVKIIIAPGMANLAGSHPGAMSTGEAFVEFSGDDANIQQAALKDRAVLGGKPVSVFRSSLEEVQRVALMGRTMI
jgi:hypothetical protein